MSVREKDNKNDNQDEVGHITKIYRPQDDIRFTKEEANQMTGLLFCITKKTKNDVTSIKAKLQAQYHNKLKVQQYQEEIYCKVSQWGEKVSRLGGTPMGVWKVLIPSSEERPYEWEFPNSKVS